MCDQGDAAHISAGKPQGCPWLGRHPMGATVGKVCPASVDTTCVQRVSPRGVSVPCARGPSACPPQSLATTSLPRVAFSGASCGWDLTVRGFLCLAFSTDHVWKSMLQFFTFFSPTQTLSSLLKILFINRIFQTGNGQATLNSIQGLSNSLLMDCQNQKATMKPSEVFI